MDPGCRGHLLCRLKGRLRWRYSRIEFGVDPGSEVVFWFHVAHVPLCRSLRCRVPSQTRCWRSLIVVVFDSPFAEKDMSIALAMEAGDGSGHSRQSRHLTAATGHPFEEVMATCHPPDHAGQVAGNSSDTQSSRNWCVCFIATLWMGAPCP